MHPSTAPNAQVSTDLKANPNIEKRADVKHSLSVTMIMIPHRPDDIRPYLPMTIKTISRVVGRMPEDIVGGFRPDLSLGWARLAIGFLRLWERSKCGRLKW